MDAIMDFLAGFDPAALLPDISTTLGLLVLLARLAILAVPVILLVLGLVYFFRPPKEANHRFGYRTYFGMGSVEAWQYTQWLAGIVYGGLGAVLTLVMLIIGIALNSNNPMSLLTSAAVCIVVEIVLTVVASLAINITALIRYDRDGYRRGTR